MIMRKYNGILKASWQRKRESNYKKKSETFVKTMTSNWF